MLFDALVVEELDDDSFAMHVRKKEVKDLPEGDVLIRVRYSSLNYKDALSATGNRGVTKRYPHTPGIDAAGEVVASDDSRFSPGEQVIVSGYDLGMNTAGGFEQYIRVPGDWVVKLPESLTPLDSMILGTAGFTAGLCVEKIMAQVRPEDGEVVVTGATGGVGSLATVLLAQAGYEVVAVTGKRHGARFLKNLGAKRVVGREDIDDGSGKPLVKGMWAGGVDTVGGEILAAVLRATTMYGAVTCCGNVLSSDLHMSLFPFILRGVSLLGISAQNTPMKKRKEIWQMLADTLKPRNLQALYEVVSLDGLELAIQRILRGEIKGRVVVDLR
ncbi:MAG: oxidoreductase [Deltaproteobacteria bacterium]|nr:MAG: oxidoreductase [Deltaproteobacteria bacterium]